MAGGVKNEDAEDLTSIFNISSAPTAGLPILNNQIK